MGTIIKIGLVATDRDGRLLVVRKRGGRTFILPGGKPEKGESDEECLVREVHEELGIVIDGPFEHVGNFGATAADMEGTMVMVRAYRAEIRGEPRPCAEIQDMHWLDPNEPDAPIADSIRMGILPAIR